MVFLKCNLKCFYFRRPPFDLLEVWFEYLVRNAATAKPVPPAIIHEINHFKGVRSNDSSISTTPDGLATPPLAGIKPSLSRKRFSEGIEEKENCEKTIKPSEGVDVVDCVKPSIGAHTTKDNVENNNITNSNSVDVSGFIVGGTEIPRSPHLCKDFSPNGDRIRDSIRARRRQRIILNRENQRKSLDSSQLGAKLSGMEVVMNPETSASEPTSLIQVDVNALKQPPSTEDVLNSVRETLEKNPTLASRREGSPKAKHYGEKGFIIHLNNGNLTLNNVKDLEACSDFDSSCDTSLNYIDLNASSSRNNHLTTTEDCNSSKLGDVGNVWSISGTDSSIDKVKESSDITTVQQTINKNALEELRAQLNMCKKDVLEKQSEKENVDLEVECKDPKSNRMFCRINPLTSILGGKNSSSDKERSKSPIKGGKYTSKLFRVSDTPIFERRNISSPVPPSLKRSESGGQIKPPKVYSSDKSMFGSKQKVSPTSDLKPQSSFEDNAPTSNSYAISKLKSSRNIFSDKNLPQVFVYKTKKMPGVATAAVDVVCTNSSSTSSNKSKPLTIIEKPPISKRPPASGVIASNSNNLLSISKNRTFRPTEGSSRRSKDQRHEKPVEKYVALSSSLSGSASNSRAESPSPTCGASGTYSRSGTKNRTGILSPESVRRLNARLLESRKQSNESVMSTSSSSTGKSSCFGGVKSTTKGERQQEKKNSSIVKNKRENIEAVAI